MGTREVYEEKLRSGNLYHQPTINPGLGSARCPRCFSLVNPESEAGDWTITTVLHDATAVAGSGAGGMLSAIHGLNHGMPYIRNRVKGPMWLHLILGLPPILLYSAAGAVLGVTSSSSPLASTKDSIQWFGVISQILTWYQSQVVATEIVRKDNRSLSSFSTDHTDGISGYALPRFAQCSVTSYYAASSASHYAISQFTRRVEGVGSGTQHEKPT
ncbi:hypothetical protein EJ110_NYTH48616 [Nymphaea thermarum]|nr:hypothetical protein EJ110_NYTH48616 [Nymphaea thermarum]